MRFALPADEDRLLAVLVRAFDADPLVDWLVLDDRRRAKRLECLFRWLLRRTVPLGTSLTTADHAAVALWSGPSQWRLSLVGQLLLFPRLIEVAGIRRLLSRIYGVSLMQKKHPAYPHHHLVALATEPALQGRGFGSRLLAEGLKRSDQLRLPAYLETAVERNVAFYQRQGFRVLEQFTLPRGGPRAWCMARMPPS